MYITRNLQGGNGYPMTKEKREQGGSADSGDSFGAALARGANGASRDVYPQENQVKALETGEAVPVHETVRQWEVDTQSRFFRGVDSVEDVVELEENVEAVEENTGKESIFVINKPHPSLFVYQMGFFPDEDFFAEMFLGNDFSNNNGDCVETMGVETMGTEETVYGYCSPNGYQVWFEYAEESTTENPMMYVRLEHTESKKAWEGTMEINEINPRNASKIEMIVLSNHLTGSPVPFLLNTMGLDKPYEKQDYFAMLQETLVGNQGSVGGFEGLEDLEDLLDVLDDFMDALVDEA